MPTFIMRASKDTPTYVGWSTIVDGPVWVAPDREAALTFDAVDPERLDRTDEIGTSNLWGDYPRYGSWEDDRLMFEGSGTIARAKMPEIARRLLLNVDADLADLVDLYEDEDD